MCLGIRTDVFGNQDWCIWESGLACLGIRTGVFGNQDRCRVHSSMATFGSALFGSEDVVESVGLDAVRPHRFPVNDPYLVRGKRGSGSGEGGGVRNNWALTTCVQVRGLRGWVGVSGCGYVSGCVGGHVGGWRLQNSYMTQIHSSC